MKINYPAKEELEKNIEILTRQRECCYSEKRKLDTRLNEIEREILTCSQLVRFHNKEDL